MISPMQPIKCDLMVVLAISPIIVIGTLSVTSIKSHYLFTIRPAITITIRPCNGNDMPFIQNDTV